MLRNSLPVLAHIRLQLSGQELLHHPALRLQRRVKARFHHMRMNRWTAGAFLCAGAAAGAFVFLNEDSDRSPRHIREPVPVADGADLAAWQGAPLLIEQAAFGLIGDAEMGSGGRLFLLDAMERRAGIAAAGGEVSWTGRPGRGPEELFVPVALAAGADVLYVLDRGTRRIQRYRTDGGRLEASGSLPLPFGPEDLCVLDGRVFVLGAFRGYAIHEVSTEDGRVLRSLAPDAQLSDDLLATFRAGGYLSCGPGERIGFLPLLRPEVRLFSAATGALLDTVALPGYNAVLIRKTADAVEFRGAKGGTHDMGASVVALDGGRMLVQTGAVRPGAATIHEFTSVRTYLVDWRHGSARILSETLPRIAAARSGLALALETDPQPAVRVVRLTLPPVSSP